MPGSRAVIECWEVSGNRAIPTDIILNSLARGGALSLKTVESATRRVLRLYEWHGRPLAVVKPREAEPVSHGRYRIVLDVDEGDVVELEHVSFAGAGRVSPRVLERVARFAPSEWRPDRIAAWRRNLSASRLVRVEGERLVESEQGYALLFSVKPERASRATAAAGYDAARAEFSGFVSMDLLNIANSGRRLRGAWASYRGRARYELEYREPWVFRSAVSLTAGARHRTQDTSGARTELELAAFLPVDLDLDLTIGAGYEQTVGIETAAPARTALVTAGISWDAQMSQVDPGFGGTAALRTRAGRRETGTSSSFIGRAEADAGLTGPRLGRMLIENRLHARVVETSAILSDIETYPLGGALTVRGHREDELTSRRVAWWNCEFGWRVDRTTAAYVFVDVGAAQESGHWRLPVGYGPGARVGTAIGRFDAAYGLAPRSSLLAGKVHLSYQGDF